MTACQSQPLLALTSKHSNFAMAQTQSPATVQSQMVAQQENYNDDSPMVHTTEADYATWAPKYKAELLAEGKEAVLESELKTLIPSREGEDPAEYTKRYVKGHNDMISRGVAILNDMTTHDVAPGEFHIDGHEFDVGPESGIMKREYREFGEYVREDVSYADIPKRFLKFEVTKPHEEM